MANYKLISHSGGGRCLNIYGNGQASPHRNVCLWTDSGTSEQKWSIPILSGSTRILSVLNTAYGLNVWRGSDNMNNCDIYPVSGNEYDSLITVIPVDSYSGIYKFKLKNYSLYLTAKGTSNGSDVRWEISNGNSNQQWRVVPVGGGDTSILQCPVDNPSISSPYGWRTLGGKREFHHGIDYRAARYTPIKAAADGRVIYIHDWENTKSGLDSIGYAVYIQHSFGLTQYFHMNEKTNYVNVGDYVNKGDQIGRVGTSGYSTGYHLHFGFKTGTNFKYNDINAYNQGTWQNPADYMN